MKPSSRVGFLLFFILVLKEVSSRNTNRLSNIVERLNSEYPKYSNALVVVVKKSSDFADDTANYELDFDDRDVTNENGLTSDANKDVYEEAKEEAKLILYKYLSRSGPEPENTQEDKEEKIKDALRAALRARCQKRQTCERKCEPKKPSCPMNCQKVFDEAELCDPPKEPQCPKKDNSCDKKGRTMPPNWRL